MSSGQCMQQGDVRPRSLLRQEPVAVPTPRRRVPGVFARLAGGVRRPAKDGLANNTTSGRGQGGTGSMTQSAVNEPATYEPARCDKVLCASEAVRGGAMSVPCLRNIRAARAPRSGCAHHDGFIVQSEAGTPVRPKELTAGEAGSRSGTGAGAATAYAARIYGAALPTPSGRAKTAAAWTQGSGQPADDRGSKGPR
jgi:hypothetical protein